MDEAGEYRFVCGADMAPEAVREAYPGATFVARARLADGEDEVWGILLRVPAGAAAGGETRSVVTDDGRRVAAVAPTGGAPAGDPAAVLAEARYWELPPGYVARLAAALGGGDIESK